MEQAPLLTVGFVLLGYCCGLVPTGVLLTRRRGLDLRHTGSGNPGATNVLRTAGIGLGLATLVGDLAKGALPAGITLVAAGRTDLASLAGVAAVVGHCYPIGAGFDGGKGVATALGALLVCAPSAAAIAAVVFAVAVWATRIVSVGSLLGALAAPLAAAGLDCPLPITSSTGAMALIIWIRHRPNLRRLRAGTEPHLTAPKKQAAA